MKRYGQSKINSFSAQNSPDRDLQVGNSYHLNKNTNAYETITSYENRPITSFDFQRNLSLQRNSQQKQPKKIQQVYNNSQWREYQTISEKKELNDRSDSSVNQSQTIDQSNRYRNNNQLSGLKKSPYIQKEPTLQNKQVSSRISKINPMTKFFNTRNNNDLTSRSMERKPHWAQQRSFQKTFSEAKPTNKKELQGTSQTPTPFEQLLVGKVPLIQNNLTINIQNLQNIMNEQKKKSDNFFRPNSSSLRKTSETKQKQQQINQSMSQKQQPSFNPIYKIICSYRTKQGYLASNPEKINQDAYQICQNFGKKGQHLFFVCDGHGQNGHLVSNYIKINYPKILQKYINMAYEIGDGMKLATREINDQINSTHIDTRLSGSTFIQMSFETTSGKVVTGNVGDSRAIVGCKQNGKWTSKWLSQDHKPNLEEEQRRINICGGRVDCYRDQLGRPVGPMRVWLRNENTPGLAMSRSMGDQLAASVGVSHEPDVMEYTITDNDHFIILASDGVWEFLSNDQVEYKFNKFQNQVVDIVGPFYDQNDVNGACENLMKESYYQWTQVKVYLFKN